MRPYFCQCCDNPGLRDIAGADRMICPACRTVHAPTPTWPGVEIVAEYLIPEGAA